MTERHTCVANQSCHVTKPNPGVSSKLGGEGVVMGGEEQAAVNLAAHVLQHCVGDCIAIKGAGSSPQLVQHYQAVWCCVLQCSQGIFSAPH